MAIVARDTTTDFVPAPEGLHPAVCVDVVDLGKVKQKFGERHTIDVRWQIDKIYKETGTRFLVNQWYTLSLHEKSNLRRDLESWRGKKFNFNELANGFDLEILIGVNCQIQVIHATKEDGRTFANVSAVLPFRAGDKIMKPVGYVRQINREEEQAVDESEEPADVARGEDTGGTFQATEEDVPF